jgi:hypothetical protein
MQQGALLLLEQILAELIGPFVQFNLQGHLGSVELSSATLAYGYAAHQAVGALFAAGDAVPVSILDTVR